MGKTKLKIKRLETVMARQAKFAKRKVGFVKKAKELATLCDIDLALAMFSPIGKPSLYVGQNKSLSCVLERLSNLSMENLDQRKVHTKKIIKKMLSKNGQGADTGNNLPDRNGSNVQGHLQEMQERLKEKKKMISDWRNPESVDDLERIKEMEAQLISNINKLKAKKIQLQNKNNGA